MSQQLALPSCVMEGKGAYNAHAKLQAGGAALALPLLKNAVRGMEFDSGNRPIVIADYGSSQGRNSLAPICLVVGILRELLNPDRPVLVFHVDQPANDFNSLFEVLNADSDSYALADPWVFPCAVGRSFYESVLPPDSVDIGWSSYAAHWLSRIPALVPGHFVVVRSTEAVRAEFARQASLNWQTFLSLRAAELRSGGRLVILLPGLGDDGLSGFEDLFDHGNAALAALVRDGTIWSEELARMVLGAYPRRRCELLAPFERDGRFCGLVVEHCGTSVLADPAWADYRRDGDERALAAKRALFFRSAFAPSLASALAPERFSTGYDVFADRLERELRNRLESHPAPLDSLVQTIVLSKES